MIAGAEHFFVTNNIAETLHHKMNLYLPNKKINNHNFIISLRNVIRNYETLKTNIKRHDYITKSLIKYSKNITAKNFKWLDYETFKKLEKEVISNINDNIDINVIDELLESLNGFSIKDSDNKNSSNEVLENDINNQIDDEGLKNEYSSEDENENFLDNKNNNDEGKEDSIEEELFDELKNGNGISGMFLRLIEDKKNISCKDVIKNFVEKIIKKRSEIEDDSDMVEILKLIEKLNKKKKVKINYPKKK